MNKELMITKEDLVNWLDRSPSNDDLDLICFITTRLENFYKLQEENNKLKENWASRTKSYNKVVLKNADLEQEKKELQEKLQTLKYRLRYEEDYYIEEYDIDELLKILKGDKNE